MYLTYGL